MLEIDVKLLPGGVRENTRVLGTIQIINIDGDEKVADYEVRYTDVEREKDTQTFVVEKFERKYGYLVLLELVLAEWPWLKSKARNSEDPYSEVIQKAYENAAAWPKWQRDRITKL